MAIFQDNYQAYPNQTIFTEFTQLVPLLGALGRLLFHLGLSVLQFVSLFEAIKAIFSLIVIKIFLLNTRLVPRLVHLALLFLGLLVLSLKTIFSLIQIKNSLHKIPFFGGGTRVLARPPPAPLQNCLASGISASLCRIQ